MKREADTASNPFRPGDLVSIRWANAKPSRAFVTHIRDAHKTGVLMRFSGSDDFVERTIQNDIIDLVIRGALFMAMVVPPSPSKAKRRK